MEVGDLSDRFQLREDLQCQDFQWYISNVYPELYAPPAEDIVLSGEVNNFKNVLLKVAETMFKNNKNCKKCKGKTASRASDSNCELKGVSTRKLRKTRS